MMYLGDFVLGSIVYLPFNTFDSSGASCTVTNFIDTDVHIHKDGGLVQRNNAAGVVVSIDYDSITGNHLIAIDTSDNTVAGFFAAGHEYDVRLEGITVDGKTLNVWVGKFSIENRLSAFISKLLANKAVQNKETGAIEYFDDDGETVILTHTPTDSDTEITRTPS